MADLQQWTLGWGLGLMLHRRGDRLLIGHDGAMPGFLASMVVHRESRLGVVVLTNTGRSAGPASSRWSWPARCWTSCSTGRRTTSGRGLPAARSPADVEPMLGTWWSEGTEYALSWRGGEDERGRPRGRSPRDRRGGSTRRPAAVRAAS